ncbi:hypothetical protein B0H19DRAFT_1121462 [Mycena capillaripes]|nr:hypothetical protein B0H19DRAFT_1121462 [Mycena capillaripes]
MPGYVEEFGGICVGLVGRRARRAGRGYKGAGARCELPRGHRLGASGTTCGYTFRGQHSRAHPHRLHCSSRPCTRADTSASVATLLPSRVGCVTRVFVATHAPRRISAARVVSSSCTTPNSVFSQFDYRLSLL